MLDRWASHPARSGSAGRVASHAELRRRLRGRHARGPQRGRPGQPRDRATASTSRAPTRRSSSSENAIELHTASRGPARRPLRQVLEEKLVKRKVSLKALDYGKVEEASDGHGPPDGHAPRRHLDRQGPRVGKYIKGLGLKGIQHQTQGDQLRVTGKKRDDLQAVIAVAEGRATSASRCSSPTSATEPAPALRARRCPFVAAAPARLGVAANHAIVLCDVEAVAATPVAEAGDAVVGRRVGRRGSRTAPSARSAG